MFICFKFNCTCISIAMGEKQNKKLVMVQLNNKNEKYL